MQPFTSVTGVAVPLIEDDINTDQIAPIQMVRGMKPDYRALLFLRQRRLADGSEDPNFLFNRPQFRDPAILVTGKNFGCGSSREAAVWCMLATGIRCIVARSFADIYRENCLQNGLLPIELPSPEADSFETLIVAANGASRFTVDLERQRISGPDGLDIPFDIPAADRMRLLEGLDDIGLTLKHTAEIEQWERRTCGERPWQQTAEDNRSQKGHRP